MGKKYIFIDILFGVFFALFVLLSLYELLELLIPFYTYLRALAIFAILCILYFGYIIVLGKISENTPQWGYLLYGYIKKYIQIGVYGMFILLAIAIQLGQVYDITVFIVYGIMGFAPLYFYARLIGYTLDTSIKKSSLFAYNTLRFFIILYAIFFIILHYLVDTFSVPDREAFTIYIAASLIYLISGYFIFFDASSFLRGIKKYLTQKLFRPYPIFMSILIIGLTGYLIAKNNLISQIHEGSEIPQSAQQEGGIVLPEVVSGELNTEDQPSEQENIEYETVLVSDRYNIEPGLTLGSIGQSVTQLQTVLGNLQYFLGEINGEFDETVRGALIDALQSECGWPESTQGIFGPLAKQCIDNLEITTAK